MITNLQIRNFRGLKDVTLRELRRVNLLVGGNDTGKTSLLEALILLLADGTAIADLPIMFRNNQSDGQRGHINDERENFWNWLFYDRNPKNGIWIAARVDKNRNMSVASTVITDSRPGQLTADLVRRDVGNTQTVVKIETHEVIPQTIDAANGFRVSRLSTRPSHPAQDAEKYNQIALESGGEAEFERIMREVEPRLKRLRYAKLPGTSSALVFADIGLSRSVPATQMGQAFNRLLHIYAEILTSKTNVLLIDEIENGIFSESLQLIWKGLFAVCEQQDVQIFATTHSRECVMAAYVAADARGKDELSVQRLQIVNGNVEAVRLGQKHLEMASEMGLEVRS